MTGYVMYEDGSVAQVRASDELSMAISTPKPVLVLDPSDPVQMSELSRAINQAKRSLGSGASPIGPKTATLAMQKMLQPPMIEPTDPAVRVTCSGFTWAKIGNRWMSTAGRSRTWDEMLRHGVELVD